MPQSEMPRDWDDHAGWERYYSALTADGDDLPHGGETSLQYAAFILGRSARRIWFPGCGIALGPKTYTTLGLEVLATDVSPSAIAHQQRIAGLPWEQFGVDFLAAARERGRLDLAEAPVENGALEARVQDFRTPLGESGFDFVLNIKSLQALPLASMAQAAKVHADAVAPGGYAIFQTQNVQGDRRDQMEECLRQAGFFVPYFEANRWYRARVAELNIPHAFILGRPMVLGGDRRYLSPWGQRRVKKDQERLDALRDDYQERLRAEKPETDARTQDGQTKVATVVYNTG